MKLYPHLIREDTGYRFFVSPEKGGPKGSNYSKNCSSGTYITGSMDEIRHYVDKLNGRNAALAKVIENYLEYSKGTDIRIMGIVNVTPDSFSDGGLYLEPERAVEHGMALVEQGADILDIGGESTRPGSDPISVEEELKRVLPVIKSLRRKTDVEISIDTTKHQVALPAIEAGATWINDVSGLNDESMIRLAAEKKVKVVIMHCQGVPKTMQESPRYENIFSEISTYLVSRAQNAEKAGVLRKNIIIDPGIGFGKSAGDNYTILKHLDFLWGTGYPVCIGTSRKSFLKEVVAGEIDGREAATLTTNFHSVLKGARIIRVHDVRTHRQMVDTLRRIAHA